MRYYVKSNPWCGIMSFTDMEEALLYAKNLIARGYAVHIYPMEA